MSRDIVAYEKVEVGLNGVHAFYPIGDDVTIVVPPTGTTRIVARSATRGDLAASLDDALRIAGLPVGTYEIVALDADGKLLGDEITTVGTHQGERPVHGFATSFGDDDVESVVAWNGALRSTVVQIYDWMESYTEPLGSKDGWKDPSNRTVSFDALRAMAAAFTKEGVITHAYAPIYAVGNQFAHDNPAVLMYRGDGEPIQFLDQIVLANPGNAQWQRHFVQAYGDAADAIGFDGFHVDTYGYPRVAQDAGGVAIDSRVAYESFLEFLRTARPDDLISFNQVNGVPSAARISGAPDFRYCEIWPPNTEWRHFEGLLDRSAGVAGHLAPATRSTVLRGSIACYPPVWGVDDPKGPVTGAARESALRTDVATEAIATMLGASALIFGDRSAALCDPYYPKHAHLSNDEADTVIKWRHFALRCRDLFIDGEDTSWYEIGDENGSVSVETTAPVLPEPVGGSVFARVTHGEGYIAVGVLDLTGSANGRWTEPTSRGAVSSVTAKILVDHPGDWHVEVAVLGSHDDRFTPMASIEVDHRQGRALQVELPLVDGWSVLRLRRGAS